MQQGQKNWEYDHVENAWPIVHAFLPLDKEYNDTPVLKQKLGILQSVECNNHLRGGVVNIYNLHDTSWIISMQKLGYKYACVWFEGVWPDSTEFNLKLLDEIDRYNKEDPEWVVAGQLQCNEHPPGKSADYEDLHKNARYNVYPYFLRTMIIINLKKWDENKRPSPFFEPAHHPQWINYDPSIDHEDSSYRLNADPDWKFADGQDAVMIWQHNYGASWVQWSFVRDLTVWGISDALMERIYITRPYMGQKELEKGITGQKYDSEQVSRQGNKLIKRMFEPTSPIYFVNTEPSSPGISQQALDTNFEQYVGCTAGFKLLYYAYKYGMTESTRFVWFDFDADSVQFKRDTIKHWDGEDFPEWVETWVHAHPTCNTGLLHLVAERWPNVIGQFDGTQSWLAFWNRVKECEHEFFTNDLIYNHDDMFDAMTDCKTFFWSSNIYSYITPKLMAKPFELERSFMRMMDRVKNTNADSWFSGTDVNDNDLMCPARVVLSATDNQGIGLE